MTPNTKGEQSLHIHNFIMAVITVQKALLCSLIAMTIAGVILCITASVFSNELDLLVYQPAELTDVNLDGVQNYNLLVQLKNYLAINGSLSVVAGLIGIAATVLIMRRNSPKFHLIKIGLVLVVAATTVNTILVPYGAFQYGRFVGTFKADLSRLVRDYDGRFHNAEILGPIQYSASPKETSLILDLIQLKYHCCGVNGGADFATENLRWNTSRTLKLTTGADHMLLVPPTCCKTKKGLKIQDWLTDLADGDQVSIYLQDSSCGYQPSESPGCHEVIDKKLKPWAHGILFLFFLLISSQVGTIVFASIWIYTKASKEDRTMFNSRPSTSRRYEPAGQQMVQTSDVE